MKTTFKLAFVACLMVLSSACHAQKPIPDIDQAFDKFVQDLSQDDLVTSSTMNTYNIGMMKGFEFAVPRKKQKMVDTFHKALLSNSRLAYISFTKKAGSASIETNRVGYGNNNSTTYLFGAHKDRNYNLQYIRDRKDSTMRYVYALVWYPGKNDVVLGSVYKFYSKDPQAYKMSLSYKMNAVQGLDSLVSLGNIRYNKNLVRSYGLDMTPPKDAAEFIMQLNTLRAAFKNARDQYPYLGNQVTRRTLQTGVANKIVKLCKGYGKLLNADEKNFLANSLNKMKKDTDDDYLQSLLELTSNSLRK
ncbi:hypothetical protein KSW89_10225 [Prevotella copri]|jgi:hypothetical protein|uniref:DUF4835 family protein n=1 Tax=Segatella copri TaxID=165179 RepID=A0AAW4NBZ6_9BACT|nr:hypothetical protein [Segatella copri]MBU9911670.1 hypothetical protein [Segatella copri]MBV3399350.1 hypothetical protein [Segatella copri]MBV3408975.1 hypothetical protein [Segatella copri]MBV3411845.1 hypothetical protein [Segatella copri]MBV3420342.1 hypothetical protein [Segatella copri]